MNKKFEWETMVTLTNTGNTLVEYFKEYRNGSPVVKDVIRKAAKVMVPQVTIYNKLVELFENSLTEEDFFKGILEGKILITKESLEEIKKAAIIFTKDFFEDTECTIIEEEKDLKHVVVRKMIGFKATNCLDTFNLKEYTDMANLNREAREAEELAYLFNENASFIKQFLNVYVKKNLENYFSSFKDALLNKGIEVLISNATQERYINLNVDFKINLYLLSYDLLEDVRLTMVEMEKESFY